MTDRPELPMLPVTHGSAVRVILRRMTEDYTIWTMDMKGSVHGGMAHFRRVGDATAICGAEAAFNTEQTDYQRVHKEAADGGGSVYPCSNCMKKAPKADD